MKIRIMGVCFLLGLLLISHPSFAELDIDISGSYMEPTGTNKFRIRNLSVSGASVKYWVDFEWDGTKWVFYPLDLGPETYEINTFLEGISFPSGLDIHPTNRFLYVNNGTTGRVWKIPIQEDGTAGSATVVTDAFSPNMDIVFDASGNLYGLENGSRLIYRLGVSGEVSSTEITGQNCGMDNLSTGITVESPGLTSNSLYFSGSGSSENSHDIQKFDLNLFVPNDSTDVEETCQAHTCGTFRFLYYREDVGGIAGTHEGSLVNINPSNWSCTTLLSGLVQPNGIAGDDFGNIYVADTGAGRIVKITSLGDTEIIAENLISPTGLAYDSEMALLFVAETGANKISVITLQQ